MKEATDLHRLNRFALVFVVFSIISQGSALHTSIIENGTIDRPTCTRSERSLHCRYYIQFPRDFTTSRSGTSISKVYSHWYTYREENYWYTKEENDYYERRYWHKEEDDGDKTGENYSSDNCFSPFFNTYFKKKSKKKRRRQQKKKGERDKPRTSREQKEDEADTGSRGQKQDSPCVYTHPHPKTLPVYYSTDESSSDDLPATTSDSFSSCVSSSDAQDRGMSLGIDMPTEWCKLSIEEIGNKESCLVAPKVSVGIYKIVVKSHFPVHYSDVDMPCIKPVVKVFYGNME